MTKNNFDRIIKHVFDSEGGFVNHPKDPGAATNMGITHATLAEERGHQVSVQDVKELTQEEALNIYRKRYWDKVKGNFLADGFDMLAMDGAVNSGIGRGVKWLQKGLGVTADGIVGTVTISTTKVAGLAAIEKTAEARLSFLQGLRNWQVFGKGWGRRVARVEAEATLMWHEANSSFKKEEVINIALAKTESRKIINKKKGVNQTAGTGAVTAGGSLTDMPPTFLTAFLFIMFVILVLVFLQVRGKANYLHELKRAYDSLKGA